MFKYYHVLVGNKHIDIVKAISEEDAINQVYMRFGSASKYTGLGPQQYRAVEC